MLDFINQNGYSQIKSEPPEEIPGYLLRIYPGGRSKSSFFWSQSPLMGLRASDRRIDAPDVRNHHVSIPPGGVKVFQKGKTRDKRVSDSKKPPSCRGG